MCIYIYIYTCLCMCTYIFTYIFTYIYIYIYIYAGAEGGARPSRPRGGSWTRPRCSARRTRWRPLPGIHERRRPAGSLPLPLPLRLSLSLPLSSSLPYCTSPSLICPCSFFTFRLKCFRFRVWNFLSLLASYPATRVY